MWLNNMNERVGYKKLSGTNTIPFIQLSTHASFEFCIPALPKSYFPFHIGLYIMQLNFAFILLYSKFTLP